MIVFMMAGSTRYPKGWSQLRKVSKGKKEFSCRFFHIWILFFPQVKGSTRTLLILVSSGGPFLSFLLPRRSVEILRREVYLKVKFANDGETKKFVVVETDGSWHQSKRFDFWHFGFSLWKSRGFPILFSWLCDGNSCELSSLLHFLPFRVSDFNI